MLSESARSGTVDARWTLLISGAALVVAALTFMSRLAGEAAMARARRAAATTLERKIHFYRADIGVDGGGRPLAFDPSPALTAINALPFADGPNGRYLVDDAGNAVCAWPRLPGALQSLLYCQIRRTGLPQLEQAGAVSDLNIAADAGLLEPVHIIFFPDNIVGADFNFYGPRLSRLGYYLRVKSSNAVPLASFHPLLRLDVAAQLDHLTEIRLCDLRVKASYVETVRQADASLGEAFAANVRVLDGDVDELELVLRPSKETRLGALQRLMAPLRRLVHARELREYASRFQVRGKHDETGRVEVIDLQRDQLIVHKQILRLGERSRAVDATSAFEAIRAAHDELGDDLRRAAAVTL